MEEKGIGFLIEVVRQGGLSTLLLVLLYILWKENRRLTRLVEKNAENTLDLLLRLNKVVGRFNRIAGGGGDDDDTDE